MKSYYAVVLLATLTVVSSAEDYNLKSKFTRAVPERSPQEEVTEADPAAENNEVTPGHSKRNRTASERWNFGGINFGPPAPPPPPPPNNNNQLFPNINNLIGLPSLPGAGDGAFQLKPTDAGAMPGLAPACRGDPIDYKALKALFPPGLRKLVNHRNVEALRNTFTLAGLVVAASSGNPVDIMKLLVFFVSFKNPILPLTKLGADILRLLPPNEISRQFPQIENVLSTIDKLDELYQNLEKMTSAIENAQ